MNTLLIIIILTLKSSSDGFGVDPSCQVGKMGNGGGIYLGRGGGGTEDEIPPSGNVGPFLGLSKPSSV